MNEQTQRNVKILFTYHAVLFSMTIKLYLKHNQDELVTMLDYLEAEAKKPGMNYDTNKARVVLAIVDALNALPAEGEIKTASGAFTVPARDLFAYRYLGHVPVKELASRLSEQLEINIRPPKVGGLTRKMLVEFVSEYDQAIRRRGYDDAYLLSSEDWHCQHSIFS